VVKHQLIPKRCRDYQVKYLECRMKSGLMEHEEMSKLGFVESTSWETEESEKKYLFEQINKIKKEAWHTVLEKNKDKERVPPPPSNIAFPEQAA
jgi:cytochrome c oxidase assembly protein subunit 19